MSPEAAQSLAKRKEIERCAFPLYWRRNYAYSDDAGEKRKQLPWLPYHNTLWAVLASGRRHVALNKSRQMQITWDLCAFLLWYAMFHESTEIIALSKTQRDTQYLMERINTLWRNQPQFLREWAPVNFTESEAFVNTSRSKIIALPEGEAPVRGFQANVFFLDECGHMEGFAKRYAAAIPQVNRPVNPGMIILTGTPNGHNDWWRLCKDKPQ